MKKSYILIILISFLVISPKLYAQVECPCDYEAVPKDQACWIDPFLSDPTYFNRPIKEGPVLCDLTQFTFEPQIAFMSLFADAQDEGTNLVCGTFSSSGVICGNQNMVVEDLTPEEFKTCQCELLAYTTALNEVAGISVSGGPPYQCRNVRCGQLPTPIPTLNEWGMITTAGVLGLLAVIGLFVMRRRKATA